MKNKTRPFSFFAMLIILILACNLPDGNPTATQEPDATADVVSPTSEQPLPAPEVPAVTHVIFPASAPNSKLFYDVESSATAPEKRAPYGDSYDINRLERPFLQDMTYIPDLDVETFSLSKDADWYYVSVRLIGKDPNNALGINYAVELDKNSDGFGDFIILAQPPYTSDWSADNVQVYADTNHDTSAISSVRSDAPINTDGYDSLIFDGGRGEGDDPDLAWVRINAGPNATIQFAFKRSWAGSSFMFGVLADAGLKDAAQLDYVDRFTEEEAGSPIKTKKDYPLKALYAIDNTCREAHGFDATGFEPMLCPREIPPTAAPLNTQPAGCT
ncbi:MAG: hypothetical protein Q8O48_13255, partial [Anaerolineales bacterium]|nr:hypothetical protein [Anaerolineales bacterium]